MRSAAGSYYACIGTGAGYFNPGELPRPGRRISCSATRRSAAGGTSSTTPTRATSFASAPMPTTASAALVGLLLGEVRHRRQHELQLPRPSRSAARPVRRGRLPARARTACRRSVRCPAPLRATRACVWTRTPPSARTSSAATSRGQFFASVDFDLIPKVLTLTGGGRFYHYDEFEHGSEYYSESTEHPRLVLDHLNGVCIGTPGLLRLPDRAGQEREGSRWRGNLTWHITPDMMAYYTFSEGFRPGGFNRTELVQRQRVPQRGEIPFCSRHDGVAARACQTTNQYEKPAGFQLRQPDQQRDRLQERVLRASAAVQCVGVLHEVAGRPAVAVRPGVSSATRPSTSTGPNFMIKGFEVQFVARMTEGLSVQGSSSVNSSSRRTLRAYRWVSIRTIAKTANNPTPIGQCITVVNAGQAIPNALGALGHARRRSHRRGCSTCARATTGRPNDYKPFVWVGASHIGPMTNEPRNYLRATIRPKAIRRSRRCCATTIPGYTTYDAAIGVSKDNWTAQLTGSNLSNEYGPTQYLVRSVHQVGDSAASARADGRSSEVLTAAGPRPPAGRLR